MHTIELYIVINNTTDSYKCVITQKEGGWRGILYKARFKFETVHGDSIINVLKELAIHLDDIGIVNSVTGTNVDRIYIAILETYIRINRSNRLLRSFEDTRTA